MRCLALGQAWHATGGQLVVVTDCTAPDLLAKFLLLSAQILPVSPSAPPAKQLAALLGDIQRVQPDWVVLDGYHFDLAYQEQIKMAGWQLLVLDDYHHLPTYQADLILNQNITAADYPYQDSSPQARLLLGTQYTLLRSEFITASQLPKPTNAQLSVLITMGGSDPDNVTQRILQALATFQAKPLSLTVITGPQNEHVAELKQLVQTLPHDVTLIHYVENMATFIPTFDAVICAGGSTCWEIAFFALPMFICVLADNQNANALYLANAAAALQVDLRVITPESTAAVQKRLAHFLTAPALRKQLGQRAATIIDGKGASRVVEAMLSYEH